MKLETLERSVLIDLSEMKVESHRGYEKLLCDHVYFRFCPDCPQYHCRKRDV